jgi:hypothetical protein
MLANPILTMWIAWGAVVVVTLILFAYRGTIARDEEGQIFLHESFDYQEAVQAVIRSKIARIQPVVRTSLVLAALMTLAVIGYYTWFALKALDYIR